MSRGKIKYFYKKLFLPELRLRLLESVDLKKKILYNIGEYTHRKAAERNGFI